MQDARFRLIGLALGASLLWCGGCEVANMKPGAKSILEVFKQPSPAEAAAWSIDPYDPDKRYQGTLLLANAPFANEPIYIRVFTDNARDVDPGVRAAAIRGIANHGSPDLVPLLTQHMTDPDVSVRIEAARGLQRLHNPVAIPTLLDALDAEKQPEVQVRAQAAEALGQYAETRVVDALIKALDDENLSMNVATVSALSTLTGQNFGYDRGAWAAWNKQSKSTFAARSVYMYPVFRRDKDWYEHLPFVSPPPNETASTPAGLQPTAQ
jgi:hypothetical protein